MLPGLFPLTPSPALQSTFLGSLNSVATTSIVDMGQVTAPSTGLLVVALSANYTNVRQITAVSIGGTTATFHTTGSNANVHHCLIASRVVTAGTQNITITMTSTSATASLGLSAWLLTHYRSTARFAGDASTAAGASAQTTFAIPSPSFQCWAYSASFGAAGGTFSSATPVNQTTVNGTNIGQASRVTSLAESSHVETVTLTSVRAVVGASFR